MIKVPDDWQSPGDLGMKCGTCMNWPREGDGYRVCNYIKPEDPDNFALAKGLIATKENFSCTYWRKALMVEIKKGDFDDYRNAQWWLAIDGTDEYHVMTTLRGTEADVRDFVEYRCLPPGGRNLNVIKWSVRTPGGLGREFRVRVASD